MRALAGGLEPRPAGAGLSHDDTVGVLQLVGIGVHNGVGQARHRVRGRAALELHDDARARLDGLAHEHAVVAALLAVAHGELRVGREQEGRVVVVQVVVGHVGHAGFLVRAEQEAHGIGELRRLALVLQVLPELHSVQGHDAGALVVQRAAAHKVAVLARDLVGLEGPAGAGRHHVHVADDAQLRVRGAGEVGEADIALGIMGLETHAARQLERRFERLLGAGAERGAVGLLVVFLEAGNAHERGDVIHHGVPVLLEVCVYLIRQFGLVHCVSASRSEDAFAGRSGASAVRRRCHHYAPSGIGAPDRHVYVDRLPSGRHKVAASARREEPSCDSRAQFAPVCPRRPTGHPVYFHGAPEWRNGRRGGLKNRCPRRAGSNPASGTTSHIRKRSRQGIVFALGSENAESGRGIRLVTCILSGSMQPRTTTSSAHLAP